MSVLSKYCNRDLNRRSPIQKSFELVRDFVDGREVRSFVETDHSKIIESHGSVSDWSLDSLTKAGINPSFAIHTVASASRMDDATIGVQSLNKVVDSILGVNAE